MKAVIIFILILSALAFSSFSRIEAMGKTDLYFEDDMSLFVNPANMLLRSSYIFGELGVRDSGRADTNWFTDPYTISESMAAPWFGGIFTKDLKGGSRIALGLAFNREDKWATLMNQVITGVNQRWPVVDSSTPGVYDTSYLAELPRLINKVDLLLGLRRKSRLSLGAHLYIAANRDNKGSGSGAVFCKREAFLIKAIAGFNKYFENNFFLEGSFGTSVSDFTFYDSARTVQIKPRKGMNLFGRTRMFIPMSERFSLVPVVNFEKVIQGVKASVYTGPYSESVEILQDYLDFSIGCGINFWELEKKTEFILGIDGHVLRAQDEWQTDAPGAEVGEIYNDLYVVLNFGIERQVAWDWLLIRAGGRKVLGLKRKVEKYANDAAGVRTLVHTNERMWENPSDNGTRADLIGVGLGIRFLRKLQLDFTVSEETPYRVLYLVSGKNGNIFTRFSCAYYF